MAQNAGIMHLVRKFGDRPVCNTRQSHMGTIPERFATDTKPCKRCAAIFAKWQAKKAAPSQPTA